MVLKEKDTLLLTGDSITDAGRTCSDNPETSLGDGYPAVIAKALAEKYPELGVKVINRGIGGNRTDDILRRMESDHLALHPDVITLLIGINDVWRHFDSPYLRQIDPPEYRENMAKILAQFKAAARAVYVLLPFMVLRPCDEPMYVMAMEYREIAREEAQKAGVKIVDLQAVFDAAMKNEAPKEFSADAIHPTLKGHELIANALLEEFEK